MHEGFGLTAWEAIACQVPMVIGEQSGVCRLLNDDCQGMGLKKSVRSVAVAGYAGKETDHNHTGQDVSNVAVELLDLGGHIETAKRDAATLPGKPQAAGLYVRMLRCNAGGCHKKTSCNPTEARAVVRSKPDSSRASASPAASRNRGDTILPAPARCAPLAG